MKLNRKGWGTLQMLLLTAGILIALLVAAYFISALYKSLDNSHKYEQYYDLEEKIVDASKKYLLENNYINKNNLVVYSDTLEVLGYLDNLRDNDGYPCTGYVMVNSDINNTYYEPYIICRNYKTQNIIK